MGGAEAAETAKLVSELDDLRQTLLRRQADFDNYRKRIEKERADDSKRSTARVIEGLIPVIDGFEHALAAHGQQKEYDNYRKGFELIYKQLIENVTKLGAERIDPGRQAVRSASASGDGSTGDERSRRRDRRADVPTGICFSWARFASGDGARSGTRRLPHPRRL